MRDKEIGYGLGFNMQYVPFANDMSPVDWIKPYCDAFLGLLNKDGFDGKKYGYSWVYGDEKLLQHPIVGEYALYGKTIKIENNSIDDIIYTQLLSDLRGGLFDIYKLIFTHKNMNNKMEEKNKLFIEILTKNRNFILTGAPGTGKTYLAKQLAAQTILGKEYDEKNASDEEKLKMKEQYDFVQFHPSFDYTDFVEGLRPYEDEKGNVGFRREDGIFMKFCRKALEAYTTAEKKEQAPKYVFVIDEINRGDISKIFGELFFSIDPGYRGEKGKVKTQYSSLWKTQKYGDSDDFYIPENVYIIGTMNDIDRSVESMDFAMRRRFAFKEVRAEDRMDMIEGNAKLSSLFPQIKKRMTNLNLAILTIQGLSTAYQIGAAYFLKLQNYLTSDGELEDGSWDSLWDNHLNGLLFEYLRGLPNAKEDLDTLRHAYNLDVSCKEENGKVILEPSQNA